MYKKTRKKTINNVSTYKNHIKSPTSMNHCTITCTIVQYKQQYKFLISKFTYKKPLLTALRLNEWGCLWKGVLASRNLQRIQSTVVTQAIKVIMSRSIQQRHGCIVKLQNEHYCNIMSSASGHRQSHNSLELPELWKTLIDTRNCTYARLFRLSLLFEAAVDERMDNIMVGWNGGFVFTQ